MEGGEEGKEEISVEECIESIENIWNNFGIPEFHQ
jgi:hypothetical protein